MSSPAGQSNGNTVVATFRCENGLCPYCGTKIYDVEKDFAGVATNFTPLTIMELKCGRCLYCYPDDPVAGSSESAPEDPSHEREEDTANSPSDDASADAPETAASSNASRLVTPVRAVRVQRSSLSTAGDCVADDFSVREEAFVDRRKRLSITKTNEKCNRTVAAASMPASHWEEDDDEAEEIRSESAMSINKEKKRHLGQGRKLLERRLEATLLKAITALQRSIRP